MAKLKSGKSKKGKGKKSPKKPTSILEITLSSDEDEEQDEESEDSSEAENSDEEEEQMDVDENEENTGKSLSEALIFASRLLIELQVQYMKFPSSNLGRTCCVQKLFLTFRTIFVRSMFFPCSAKRRPSDKDLPVSLAIYNPTEF